MGIDQRETELAEKLQALAATGAGSTDDPRLHDLLYGIFLWADVATDGVVAVTFSARDPRSVELRVLLVMLAGGTVPACALFQLAETLPQIERYEIKVGDTDRTPRPSSNTVSWPFVGEISDWEVTFTGTGYPGSNAIVGKFV